MTRTHSKVREAQNTTSTDTVEALVEAHAAAAREHLVQQLQERAGLDRDISFAIVVTNSGAGR